MTQQRSCLSNIPLTGSCSEWQIVKFQPGGQHEDMLGARGLKSEVLGWAELMVAQRWERGGCDMEGRTEEWPGLGVGASGACVSSASWFCPRASP